MLCRNCNKEYPQSLKFCSVCGSELIDNKQRGTKTETFIADSATETPDTISSNETKCTNCGAIVMAEEKYCITCGEKIIHKAENIPNHATVTSKQQSQLKMELEKLFNSNAILRFVWKYAIVFALYYPLFLMASGINGFTAVIDVLNHVTVLALYGYYAALIALYSKEKYGAMMVALAIRIIYVVSHIPINDRGVPSGAICRIVVLVVLFVAVYKEFKTTKQNQIDKSNLTSAYCVNCGNALNANHHFCSNCGHETEE